MSKKKKFIESPTENVGNKKVCTCNAKAGILPKGTVVYKKAIVGGYPHRNRLVILTLVVMEDGIVPVGERRHYRKGQSRRKCRVPAVMTVAIHEIDNSFPKSLGKKSRATQAIPYMVRYQTKGFKYSIGEITRCSKEFDRSEEKVCTSGIHVYRTLDEALNHV